MFNNDTHKHTIHSPKIVQNLTDCSWCSCWLREVQTLLTHIILGYWLISSFNSYVERHIGLISVPGCKWYGHTIQKMIPQVKPSELRGVSNTEDPIHRTHAS